MPMREYVCASRRRAGWVLPTMLGCVLLTVTLWAVPTLTEVSYRPIWFFFSLTSLTVAMLIGARYCLCRYVYRLTATEDGGFDFTVDEVRRLRTVCVCRVETEAIRAIAREQRSSRVHPTYDWSLGGRGCWLLTLTDGEETVTARFSPDETMAAMIAYSLRDVSV